MKNRDNMVSEKAKILYEKFFFTFYNNKLLIIYAYTKHIKYFNTFNACYLYIAILTMYF